MKSSLQKALGQGKADTEVEKGKTMLQMLVQSAVKSQHLHPLSLPCIHHNDGRVPGLYFQIHILPQALMGTLPQHIISTLFSLFTMGAKSFIQGLVLWQSR